MLILPSNDMSGTQDSSVLIGSVPVKLGELVTLVMKRRDHGHLHEPVAP